MSTTCDKSPMLTQWCQMVTLQSVQGHTGLTPNPPFSIFWHSGTLALSRPTERQSARMSKN